MKAEFKIQDTTIIVDSAKGNPEVIIDGKNWWFDEARILAKAIDTASYIAEGFPIPGI